MTPAETAVLAAALPESAVAAAPVMIDGNEFASLSNWSSGERLFGPLVAALERRRILVGPDDEDHSAVIEHAQRTHRAALRTTLAAEATAIRAVRVLRRVGIEAYVFKGLATAHLDYDDPALRTFHDADLHVERSDFDRAIEALAVDGFRASPTPMGRRWQRRFARACEMRSPDGVELDLHAAVATGYFGERLDHDGLRRDGEQVVLGGESITTFAPAARALISCYGVVLSRGPGFRLHFDLARQFAKLGTRWPEVVDFAGDDGDAVVAAAVRSVSSTFGPHLLRASLAGWAASVAPSNRALRALDLAAAGLSDGWSADARSTMLALGPTDRLRFAFGVVVSRGRRLKTAAVGSPFR